MNAPPLDPGIAAFLEALRDGAAESYDVGALRAAAAAIRRCFADPPDAPAPDLVTIAVPGHALPGAIHRAGPATGTILYLHGGGWALLDSESHAPILRRLARGSGCDVLGLDYPLAPETRFPDSLAAVVAAVAALTEAPGRWGLGPRPLILAGDSSGANLALAAAIELRDQGVGVAGLILAYGVWDADFERTSYRLFGRAPYLLTRERMAGFWDLYCPEAARRRDPRAAPLHADLAGLSPVFLAVAEQDALRDENLALAEALGSAGVAVALESEPRAAHGFWEACTVSEVARASVAAAAAWAAALIHEQERTA